MNPRALSLAGCSGTGTTPSTPAQMSSSSPRLPMMNSARTRESPSNPRYLKRWMMSLTIPSYLAADRCRENGGRSSRQSAHRCDSPGGAKKRPQQRQNGGPVPLKWARHFPQTTFSPGLSRRALQIWQDEGKSRSSPSFPQGEIPLARSEVRAFVLLLSAGNRCRMESRGVRPGAFSRLALRTFDRSRILWI